MPEKPKSPGEILIDVVVSDLPKYQEPTIQDLKTYLDSREDTYYTLPTSILYVAEMLAKVDSLKNNLNLPRRVLLEDLLANPDDLESVEFIASREVINQEVSQSLTDNTLKMLPIDVQQSLNFAMWRLYKRKRTMLIGKDIEEELDKNGYPENERTGALTETRMFEITYLQISALTMAMAFAKNPEIPTSEITKFLMASYATSTGESSKISNLEKIWALWRNGVIGNFYDMGIFPSLINITKDDDSWEIRLIPDFQKIVNRIGGRGCPITGKKINDSGDHNAIPQLFIEFMSDFESMMDHLKKQRYK